MNTKEQQFTNIIKEHERTIYTVCYMFSEDTDEVNDLYQDILVRLWQGFDSFEGKSDIRTWIYRVSLNYCINFSNRKKKQRERLNLGKGFHTDGNSLEKNLQIKQLYKRINALGLVATTKSVLSWVFLSRMSRSNWSASRNNSKKCLTFNKGIVWKSISKKNFRH